MSKKNTKAPASAVENEDEIEKGKAPPFAAKGEDSDEDEDEDEGEDEDEDEESVSKGLILVDDLEKGLEAIERAGRQKPSRKNELLSKALKTRLSADERRELEAILDGGSLSKSIEANDDLVKGMDVSPALDSLGTLVAEAVDRLSERLEKSETSRDEMSEAVAQSLIAIGGIVKHLAEQQTVLAEKIEKSLDGPARAPKAVTPAKAIERPSAVVVDNSDTPAPVNTRPLAKVLERMHIDSIEKGMGGLSKSGVVIKTELTKACVGSQLDPRIVRDAQDFVKATPTQS